MKKLITIATALLLATSVFALDFTLGVKGNVNLPVGSTPGKEVKDSAELAEATMKLLDTNFKMENAFSYNIGGVPAVYLDVGFLDLGFLTLGGQVEFGVNINNGASLAGQYNINSPGSSSHGFVELNPYSTTLDIPILVTADIPLGVKFKLGAGLGLNFSIPLAVDLYTNGGKQGSYLSKDAKDAGATLSHSKFILGMAFDVDFGFNIGKHSCILIDARYLMDFAPTKITKSKGGNSTTTELFTRRLLSLGIGYEYKF